jgi:molybdopterin converting factor subunit 1
MNQVTVLFFATLKERAGVNRVQLELPHNAHIADLKSILLARFPNLAKAMGTAIVSVNYEYSFEDEVIPDGAEIALFPPVSGGSDPLTIVQVTDGKLDLDELLQRISSPRTGAAAIFTGMVRGVTLRGDPHETLRLEYEAYIPMAEAKMDLVAREIRERWPMVEGIAIVQRIGILEPTTPTVLIACSAAHRDTGVFEAARYGIDRLKEIVPIWKKEIGPDGEIWVEGEYIPKQEDR